MPRRIYEYQSDSGWHVYNLISTIGAFIIALGVLLTVINVVRSLKDGASPGRTRGRRTRSSGSRPRRRRSTTSTSIPRVRSVEPMKDIRRQVEELSGAPQRFEAGRPMAHVVSRAWRPRASAPRPRPPPSRPAACARSSPTTSTLTKPKVQSLLLLTTVTTMYVAGDPSLALVFWTVLGGSLSSGGAGAVNHWYDRDIDAQMARTATRPVPAGRISPRAALTFGIVLAALSFVQLSLDGQRARRRAGAVAASSATCSSTRCGSSARRRRTS